jgi:hypothetical protein
MEIKDLFGNIFSLVLVALLIGAGAMAINKFGGSRAVVDMGTGIGTHINGSATNLGNFLTDWLPLILLFIAIGVVISLMINSVGNSGRN